MHAEVRISTQTENQQVDLSFLNVLQDVGVRLSYAYERVGLTDLVGAMGQDRIDCSTEMLLKPTELFRLVHIVRIHDV